MTGLRVIAAHYGDSDPAMIEAFITNKLVSLNLADTLSGRHKPTRNMFLLSRTSASGEAAGSIELYEFGEEVAFRMSELIRSSDDSGYHLK